MLQFFSASTNIVNSKRAITECLENALQGEPNLDCDLLIIYSAIGHNFREILSEARKVSPGARIVGCTGAGVIGREGPDESLKALAIMAIKGPVDEFVITNRKASANPDSYEMSAGMARELKESNPNITLIQFLPSPLDYIPFDKAIDGIKDVFGFNIPIFGGLPVDKNATSSFHFVDDQIIEGGALMVGYADPTLKIISHANHGYDVFEGVPLIVTRSKPDCICEFDGKHAWKVLTETLGLPETSTFLEVLSLSGLARELPENLWEEYGSKYGIFTIMAKNEDNSVSVPVTCHEGMKVWLVRRNEKKMFEGVEWMVKKIMTELKGNKPLAVFHADCRGRGKLAFDLIRKEEIINLMQNPICGNERIPWLGLYSAGEFAMLGGQNWFHQLSTALSVIYRE